MYKHVSGCVNVCVRYGLLSVQCKAAPWQCHYNDVIMGAVASQITSLAVAYSIVFSGADQRKHQSSSSLDFVWGIHRWPVKSPHQGPVTLKMILFDDVIAVDIQSVVLQETHFSERWINLTQFTFKNIHLIIPSRKCWIFHFGIDMSTQPLEFLNIHNRCMLIVNTCFKFAS